MRRLSQSLLRRFGADKPPASHLEPAFRRTVCWGLTPTMRPRSASRRAGWRALDAAGEERTIQHVRGGVKAVALPQPGRLGKMMPPSAGGIHA